MFMPFVKLLYELTYYRFFQCLDSGIKCDKRRTKSKNIFQFMKVYTGPDFSHDVAQIYSSSLNVFFLACFFGVGMPIMFPYALAFLTINEISMRIRLAYVLEKPYNYGNQLNRIFMKYLALAPLAYSAFGFWMYTN